MKDERDEETMEGKNSNSGEKWNRERLKEQGSGGWWRAKHSETDRAEVVKKQH